MSRDTRAKSVQYRSILRMHFRSDGQAKKSLSRPEAARLRGGGLNTYLCPICNKTHAGN